MFELKYLKNVSTLSLDAERCNGCRMCIIVCPHAVFAMENKIARIVNFDACMDCGACALNCSENAISVLSGMGCGCATMIIQNKLKGETQAGCGCGCDEQSNCC